VHIERRGPAAAHVKARVLTQLQARPEAQRQALHTALQVSARTVMNHSALLGVVDGNPEGRARAWQRAEEGRRNRPAEQHVCVQHQDVWLWRLGSLHGAQLLHGEAPLPSQQR